MRRGSVLIIVAALTFAACGSSEPDPGQVDGETTTTLTPAEADREALAIGRATWAANAPDIYEFRYEMVCECDQGPWWVVVEDDPSFDPDAADAPSGGPDGPYPSVRAIFADIDAAIEDGTRPVDVEYDTELGFPRNYVFNEPELALDGGFILRVTDFVADPPLVDSDAQQDYVEALGHWSNAAFADYDYTFTRGCFCPQEYVGPFKVEVRDGAVTSATLDGVDLFDVDVLELEHYDDIIRTVDGVFEELERALVEADSFSVTYDPELGYPLDVYIDLDEQTADEEVSFTIADLRRADPAVECSTTNSAVELNRQPNLPDDVDATRNAIFDAAMACDIERLAELAATEQFNASFGGGAPLEVWTDAESNGEPVLLDLVTLLNHEFTESEDDDGLYFTWPSAFLELEDARGAGLPPAEFAKLLTFYSQGELDEMFDSFAGYVGYRLGIDAAGTWLYFVAGD